jgi:hypothetical protein
MPDTRRDWFLELLNAGLDTQAELAVERTYTPKGEHARGVPWCYVTLGTERPLPATEAQSSGTSVCDFLVILHNETASDTKGDGIAAAGLNAAIHTVEAGIRAARTGTLSQSFATNVVTTVTSIRRTQVTPVVDGNDRSNQAGVYGVIEYKEIFV